MGNRAYVVFQNEAGTEFSPAVYLHWHGGPESVYQFLDEMDLRGVRHDDTMYEAARFVQILGDYMMPDQLSLGIRNGPNNFDGFGDFAFEDNGLYLVRRPHKGQRQVRRFFVSSHSATSAETDPQPADEWTPKQVRSERREAYKEIDQGYGAIAVRERAAALLLGALHNRETALLDTLKAVVQGDPSARGPAIDLLAEVLATMPLANSVQAGASSLKPPPTVPSAASAK
jgi:hypothetical protein